MVRISGPKCLQQIKIISFIIVIHNTFPDLWRACPSYKILHISRDKVSRIHDQFRSNSNVSLFNVLDSVFNMFRHLQSNHNDGQPPSTKRWGSYLVTYTQILLRWDDSKVVQLLQQFVRWFNPKRVFRLELLNLSCQWNYRSAKLVVFRVILPLLKMVLSKYLDFSYVFFTLPRYEIYFF